ncbi:MULTISPECIES: hypothetical protein [unclassified Ruegeria]|uniref:hypothetical protein n=1 Tax=unclassified Ruegeria TaxID=2625375 RepID=UPI001488D781|nr:MULTISPECIES: hypothetical protein [unclassified Ruegeria]NOD75200.1 hypothetical protein [Ruegeria sp. HKCCD4332]NOD87161.1 hypothetical protein [Ruegeria sp. HKCCD4318]NOE12716.1 hypothetical protein [Ruegeria sp. HKCCD4318-2]NOG09119.1 hypothetical protein [Ruegeria sp. HKCCD4315]
MSTKLALFAVFLAGSAQAQDPLSAIEWLTNPPENLPGTVLLEPPVTQNGALPDIEVTSLEALSRPLGLVSSSVTGLPIDLWQSSDPKRLADLIAKTPVRHNPAMQRLLFTLLLSETRAPSGSDAQEVLLLARLDRLMQLGAADPAQSLVQLAGPTDTQERFQRWFDATLLTGDEDRSCTALIAEPHLSRDYAAQIFCKARRGDWVSAALTLEAAHALELLPPEELAVLDRFLSPELYEDAAYLPQPEAPDPLNFRLFEAIGERLPSAPLPRAFANADLRDVAGWKAQIEAAERLTRIGALTPNQLLGLYTERDPAASGAVWDRVSAVQRFESALDTGNADAIGKTLPAVWQQMRSVGLEVPFAELFAERLSQVSLPVPATENLRWRILMLSDMYERAALATPDSSTDTLFLAALAQGDPGRAVSPSPKADAIAQGFEWSAPVPSDIDTLLSNGQLGEAILEAMQLFAHGARGNLVDLTGAIATFRKVGLEDTARRAALTLLILQEQ